MLGLLFHGQVLIILVDGNRFKPYQQMLHTSIKRAEETGFETVYLGLTASFEKRKFGAETYPSYSYMQIDDHYNMALIHSMSSNKHSKTYSDSINKERVQSI